jgi:hypothetical protein
MNETVALIRYISDHIAAYYDEERHILRVKYLGIMTPAVTSEFYHWLGSMIKSYPTKVMTSRGSIFDFRDVTEFANSNISSTARQSEQVNQQTDLHNHPVAIIARDAIQSATLTVTMRLSGQQDRKRIVKSEAEALAFIDDFHAHNAE